MYVFWCVNVARVSMCVCTCHRMQALVGLLVGLVIGGVDDDVGPQQITQDSDFKGASLARALETIDVLRRVHLPSKHSSHHQLGISGQMVDGYRNGQNSTQWTSESASSATAACSSAS
jgi:hypothetical protein